MFFPNCSDGSMKWITNKKRSHEKILGIGSHRYSRAKHNFDIYFNAQIRCKSLILV